MRFLPVFLLASVAAMGAEKAAYDSNGRIIALISEAGDVEITSNFAAVLPGGRRVPLLTRREGAGVQRQGAGLAWTTAFTLPDGGRGRIDWKSEESAAGVTYSGAVTAASALDIDAIELVFDAPRAIFAEGRLTPGGAAPIALATTRAGGPRLFSGSTSTLRLAAASGATAVDLALAQPATVTVVDRWDATGRSFQTRVALLSGASANGASANFSATLRLTNNLPAPPTARLAVDASKARFHFDGFGANYCWNNQSPAALYTLDHLKIAWARSELKAQAWDKQRANPGPEIRGDLQTMQRFQKAGVPFVVSIWWLPERLYTDPYEKPRSTHNRIIAPDKWDDLLDLLGSYLLFAKKEYGVEPDLFSFNEANIGIYVGLTPETHVEAIKRIGAHFRKLGLKTKMLLGDATGPRDTHRFVLEAAADPEALQYVGAVGFHSWGGGTPEQYTAWGDVAEWLGLPLLVTELGVDSAAYNSRSYDSYHYGLREAQMMLELLQYARPQGTQYWQFTNDYSLVRAGRDGGAVEPTARFYLMKHFTDLTPQKSEALTVTSDQKGILMSAFRKDGAYTVHILNLGAARTATLAGLPDLEWRVTETTEAAQFQQKPGPRARGGALNLELPGRSLITLTAAGRAGN
jgi:hypothetical protein